MNVEVAKTETVELLKETKVERAAKNLKPTKGKEFLAAAAASKTRPPSSVSLAQSMATSYGRRGPEEAVENTFKMTPDKKFPERDVRSILTEILSETLADTKYDVDQCRQLSKTISDAVKNRVKELSVQRYKIICIVHIGQLGKQAVRIGSRCLWDTTFDSFASCEFKNTSLFAVATVYGVYFE